MHSKNWESQVTLDQYQAMFENFPIAFCACSTGPSIRLLAFSSALLKILEADSRKELENLSLKHICKNPKQMQAIIRKINENGNVKNELLDCETLKGRPFVGLVTAVKSIDGNGKPFFAGTIENISGGVTETPLDELFLKNAIILESIGEGIVVADSKNNVIFMNASAEKQLGWNNEDLYGKPFYTIPMLDANQQLIAFDDRPAFKATEYGRSFGPLFGKYSFVRKDGTSFPIDVTVTPICIANRISGAISAFRDVTKERAVDQAKSEFVSIASHQLKTPLGISKWNLEAALGEACFAEIPRVLRDYICEVYESNERIINIVQSLLSVSRIEQGKIIDNPVNTNIMQVAQNVIADLKVAAQKAGVSLELKINKKHIPSILIDPFRLHEALENLMANSIEYNHVGGKVTTTIRAETSEVVISVKDTGIGIPPEDIDKIYSKFYHCEHSPVQRAGRSGLGLYIVKSYVDAWGGTIRFKSQPGKGTTFSITLPVKNKGEK